MAIPPFPGCHLGQDIRQPLPALAYPPFLAPALPYLFLPCPTSLGLHFFVHFAICNRPLAILAYPCTPLHTIAHLATGPLPPFTFLLCPPTVSSPLGFTSATTSCGEQVLQSSAQPSFRGIEVLKYVSFQHKKSLKHSVI